MSYNKRINSDPKSSRFLSRLSVTLDKNLMNYEKSIYFRDIENNEHFLFQIINYGKDTEHLKFVFNSPKDSTAITYTESDTSFEKSDIIGRNGEITYHNDGTILFKFPKGNNQNNNPYINPFGNGISKLPLQEIRDWIPIISYKIADYSLCKKTESKFPVFVPTHEKIFNGTPFKCIIYLGHMAYANPPNNGPIEMIFRLNDVAENIDLIIWFFKSNFRGQIHRIPNTDIDVAFKNVINVVEKNS